jgi:hypothetical protein
MLNCSSYEHRLETTDREKSISVAEQYHSITTRERLSVVGHTLRKILEPKVEVRGIERVPEDERDRAYLWNKYVFPSLQTTAI